jgi:ABC-type sugar transport system ATPase subunit
VALVSAEAAGGAPAPPPVLALRDVVVAYGALRAIDGVSLALRPGQVVGVCGDNGAGKSSLMKVVAGAQAPTSGAVLVDGVEARFAGPRDALARGIAAIYQDLALAPRLTIAENVFMGAELVRGGPLGLLDRAAMRTRAAEYLARLGIDMPGPDARVAELSGGQRQAVAIARALRWSARVVVMDEPTAALGVRETARVLALVRNLAASGVGVLLVCHNMDHVLEVASDVLVLKQGRQVAARPSAGLSPRDLSRMILTGEAA